MLRTMTLLAALAPGAARSAAADNPGPAIIGNVTGLLLWANGRSGTGTYFASMEKTYGIQPCGGQKEGFKLRGVTKSRLQRCRDDHVGQPYATHIKPWHLYRTHDTPRSERYNAANDWNHAAADGQLASPGDFMREAYGAGFKVVVVLRRPNGLARAVSAFEMHSKERPAWWPHRIGEFLHNESALLEAGVVAAAGAGMDVLAIDFDEVGDPAKLCAAMADTWRRLGGEARGRPCVVHVEHTKTSHHELTLEERVGRDDMRAVQKALAGTDYEWMIADVDKHRSVRQKAADAFRRIAPADPDGGGIGACAAPLVGLLLAILGVCAFRTYLVVLLAEPKEEEPPWR